ncbi:MAG: SusC/RagA family TonB-linked outer membrane protein [Saprospiraceae bacterium]|nr:MAG: SusC/RagA family TonB-linked outer membrane protein [Saprospiraceae bacterium]
MSLKHYLFSITFLALFLSASAQKTISGTLIDGQKNPLIGATILIKDADRGTISDIDGTYSLTTEPGDSILVFRYIGYQSKEVFIGNQSTINVTLEENSKVLDEVVVIGYGSVQKSDITGAIESLNPISEEVSQYNDFQGYLKGRAKGVYVQSNSSEPGGPNSIRIRGANSLRGDNEPLYVIDGIIVNSTTEDASDPLSGGNSYLSPQNGLTGISPQDIESIEVLKDASATAIYGSRGANGVILITTKKGIEGKPTFQYNLVTRVGEPTRLYDMLDAQEYVQYQNDDRELRGFTPDFYTYADGSIAEFNTSEEFMLANADSLPRLTPINWYDDIFSSSLSQNHRLTVRGGTKESKYYIAGGYMSNKGVVPNAQATVGDLLINYSQQLGKRLELSTRISASYTKNEASKGTENLGGANNSIVRQIVLGAPLLGYIENNVDTDIDQAIDGPRAWIQDYDDDSDELRTLASIKLDYKISEVFTYRVQIGADYRNKQRQVWYGTSLFRGKQSNGEAGISTLDRFRYNIDNTIMFKKRFRRGHRLDGTAGVVYDATNLEQTSFSASDFSNKDLRYEGISFGQVFQPLVYDTRKESLLSFLGRVNYSYKNRYLLTASFRTDGTSKFTENNKFSFFPSLAVAWRIINEKFMANQNTFSEAKLRLGWGLTGSQAIRPYQTLTRFGPTENLLSDANGNGITSIVPTNLANPGLIWETTNQFNAGFDWGIMNDRFTGNIDVYYKRTYDLLQELNIGPSAGFTTFTVNQGDLINKGIEFGLTANIVRSKKLKWEISGNLSFNRNEITSLGLPPTQFGVNTYSAFLGSNISGGTYFKVPANIFIEGQPAALFWGFETNGIVSNPEEQGKAPSVQGVETQLGDVLYIDQNGDGNITDQDLVIIGDPNPDFFYGFGTTLSYGGFTLNAFFNGVYGNDVANGNLAREAYLDGSSNNVRREAYQNAWSETNPNGTYPRIGYNNAGDFTDRMVEDASFLRLSYVSLGYEIPAGVIPGFQKISLFVSGQNLLLFTDYSGFDPEVDSYSFDPSRRGVDWSSFPNQKSITFGLNATF